MNSSAHVCMPEHFADRRPSGGWGACPGYAHPSLAGHERSPNKTGRSLLDRYLQGWAEADPVKVAAATTHDYRFHDPLVGTFPPQALHDYFDALRERLPRAGTSHGLDVAFLLHGPLDLPSSPGGLCFWREAPRLGLTGTCQINLEACGVAAESVAYDLNLASAMLRRR